MLIVLVFLVLSVAFRLSEPLRIEKQLLIRHFRVLFRSLLALCVLAWRILKVGLPGLLDGDRSLTRGMVFFKHRHLLCHIRYSGYLFSIKL